MWLRMLETAEGICQSTLPDRRDDSRNPRMNLTYMNDEYRCDVRGLGH
jgi:hypothetical protein